MKKIKKVLLSLVFMFLLSTIVTVTLPSDKNVTVVHAASKIKISKAKATLVKGEKLQLKIKGASSKAKISWKSDSNNIASVTSAGKVTAKKKGTATITAIYNKKSYKCKITVETPKINMNESVLLVGDVLNLKISGTTQKITWKSGNSSIASVTNSGKVTAKKKGNTTITATINKKNYKCKIYVEDPQINKTKLTLDLGSRDTLKINGTKQSIKWESSNQAVVQINDGKVFAKSIGNATISAIVGKKTYKCDVNVNTPQIQTSKIDLIVGDKYQLRITGAYQNGINWKSLDSTIAIVDEKGLVTGKKEGETQICANIQGYELKCKVNVSKVAVKSVDILHIGEKVKNEMQLEIGYSAYMDVSINPANATYKTVIWKSSNTEVADFAPGTSMLCPLAAGNTTITATVDGVATSFELTVDLPIEFSYNKSGNNRGLALQINNMGIYDVEMSGSISVKDDSGIYSLYYGILNRSSNPVLTTEGLIYPYVLSRFPDATVKKKTNASMGYFPSISYGLLERDVENSYIMFDFSYRNTIYEADLYFSGELTYKIVKSSNILDW